MWTVRLWTFFPFTLTLFSGFFFFFSPNTFQKLWKENSICPCPSVHIVLSIFWNLIPMPLPVAAYPSSPGAKVTASSLQCFCLARVSVAALPSLQPILLYMLSPQLRPLWLWPYFSLQPLPQCVTHIRHSTIFAKWKNGKRQSSETAEPGLEIRTSHS